MNQHELPMIELEPAASEVKRVAGAVSNDQLASPTPCPDYDLETMLAHVVGLAIAFRDAGRKDLGGAVNADPSASRPELPDDWCTRIVSNLDAMVEAWRDPSAWDGMTRAGGLDLPASVTGIVALDELVVHGWDIARATGQSYQIADVHAEACIGFLSGMTDRPAGGPFGPAVDVAGDARLADRVIALSGRHPDWSSPE